MKILVGMLLLVSVTAWADSNQVRYDSISGESMILDRTTVDGRLAGSEVEQKDDAAGICRKFTPVVPDPTSTYKCYWNYVDGAKARKYYLTSREDEIRVTFYDHDGGVLVGSTWNERFSIDEHGLPVLCVKTGAVVPHPIYKYLCYAETPPGSGGPGAQN